jgi:hypothetical protein
MELVNQSTELANRAIKHLNGNRTDKAIYTAVLYACTEFTDLVPQSVINDAVGRIKYAIGRADKAQTC